VSLNPRSWPNSFLFFRRKRERASQVLPDVTTTKLMTIAVVAKELTASSGYPESGGEHGTSECKPDSTIVNTALVASPAIKFKATLAAHSSVSNAASFSMSTSMPSLDQVIARIREIFDEYRLLFPPSPLFPEPLLSFVSVTERSVGIGSRIGNEPIGAFGTLALKGVRLEVVLRFLLWDNSMSNIDKAVQDLIAKLLADRDELRTKGVLRLSLKGVGVSETTDGTVWQQSADFTVLYEEPFTDTEGARSLIAQIPIDIDSEYNETTIITDEMTRWDDKDDASAPPLIVRGPLQVADLSALYFEPGAAPTGTVTLRRTFDAASGQPSAHADFGAFLAAITDPVDPDRHAEFVFNSLADFLAEFTEQGDPVKLSDDGTLVEYKLLALKIDPPIKLPLVSDRFEIVYQHNKFNQPAVLYLRAAHSITT